MKRLLLVPLLAWSLLLCLPPLPSSPACPPRQSTKVVHPPEPPPIILWWRRSRTVRSPELEIPEGTPTAEVFRFYEQKYPYRLKS